MGLVTATGLVTVAVFGAESCVAELPPAATAFFAAGKACTVTPGALVA
jgi:hypothetical protein